MARRQLSGRRRSGGRTRGTHGAEARSIGWRVVLLAAPLVYGVGVLAGDLLAVALLDASRGVFRSVPVVLLACALVSAGLYWLFGRFERAEPRSLGSIAPPRTSLRVAGAVLLPAFLFGVGLAALA